MKNFFLTLALAFLTVVGYAQTTAPSNGNWVIVDSSYNVGPQSQGYTLANLYYDNTTTTKIAGLQFRVFYDKVAFGGAKPIVTLQYSSSDQYMQYVADSVNGNITITLAYTGTNTAFTYSTGAAFQIKFFHENSTAFQALTSIDSLKVTGTLTFPSYASTIAGMDTTLSLHSYGGEFKMNRLKYHGRFTNVTGSGSKNITIALEKRPKTSTGAWTQVKLDTTDVTGYFAFDEILDTTYWDAHLYVKGDTMAVGNTVSVADAQRVNKYVLGEMTPTGFDYYASDVNGSNGITIADVSAIYGRLAGRFSVWPNSVQDVRFFTVSQYGTINGSSTNYTSSIAGVTNLTFDIIAGQPDSVTYYVLGGGDANGTGFHMARTIPIEILNPSKTPKYIIDETVEYDFPTATIEINLPKIEITEGSLVNVPMKVLTNGDQVGSAQLALAYDNTLLEFKGIKTEEKFMNWMSFLNPNNGVVEWAGADMSNNKYLANDGDNILTLQFTALSPQTTWNNSPLYVIRKYAGDANATDLRITPTNGVVKIFKVQGGGTLTKDCEIIVAPNPTEGSAYVSFSVPEDGEVSVNFYDINGKLVYTVFNGKMYKGKYLYPVDLTNVTPGTYYGVLQTGSQIKTNKTIKLN
jgi:hypothetical protein